MFDPPGHDDAAAELSPAFAPRAPDHEGKYVSAGSPPPTDDDDDDDDRRRSLRARRSRPATIALAVLAAAAAVAAATSALVRTPTPSPTKSEEATSNEDDRRAALLDALRTASPDGGSSLLEAGTPQNEAWTWLASDPDRLSVADADGTLRMYALAVLYHSTNGAGWNNTFGWFEAFDVCGWYGIWCDGGEVVGIDLSSNKLMGTLPEELIMFSESLAVLDVAMNSLSGVAIRKLPKLKELYLGGNSLKGPIPARVLDLPRLELLQLSSNEITSSNLPAIGSLSQLRELWLGHNSLDGTIPAQVFGLWNLELLDLGHNELTGSIPPAIGGLTRLKMLSLGHNLLTGAVPSQLGGLTDLGGMYLGNNRLGGTVPSQLGELTYLKYMSLEDNRLTGSVPEEVCALEFLWLFADCFSGVECSCCDQCL